MADFMELIFFICLALIAGITLLKMVNLFHKADYIPFEWSFVTFIMVILGWFVCLSILLTEQTAIYGIMFNLASLLFTLNFFFIIAELALNWTNILEAFGSNRIKSYKPSR